MAVCDKRQRQLYWISCIVFFLGLLFTDLPTSPISSRDHQGNGHRWDTLHSAPPRWVSKRDEQEMSLQELHIFLDSEVKGWRAWSCDTRCTLLVLNVQIALY
ncbi:hypothetical protein E2C01_003708 [Portunus trituberculatus]|uniref:Uncharacterized protein n=1 Tax=Portunus trituberculatus TaxID=210409 RepID=A0A5B7CRY4_PORTR|nr:hypothetical protein [Portunus trituberculatus]